MFHTSKITPLAICDSCQLKSRQLCRALRGFPQNSDQRCTPRLRAVRAETNLQGENERPQFAGILRKGYLRTERMLQDGRRSVLGFYAPGDLIGDVLGSLRGPALVSATDAEFCAFDPAALRRAMRADARLNVLLLAEAMKQHSRQLEMVWRRGALNSRERIVAFMVMAAEFMPTEPLPDGSVILSIKVSRKDWADFSNTTVETICRTLAYLAEKNVVEAVTPTRYRIRDLGVLADLAGLDSSGDRGAMGADGPLGQSGGIPVHSLHAKCDRIKPRLSGAGLAICPKGSVDTPDLHPDRPAVKIGHGKNARHRPGNWPDQV